MPQEPKVFADVVRSPNEVDAHRTADPALTPLVMVADCLPVALAGRGGVAMAHCGWRGLASGIVAEAAKAVDARAAAVGPGIGPCCYEVGEEVLAEFADMTASPGADARSDGGCRGLLARAGVTKTEASDLCTAATRSSSSPTAGTASAPAARPAWPGSDRW